VLQVERARPASASGGGGVITSHKFPLRRRKDLRAPRWASHGRSRPAVIGRARRRTRRGSASESAPDAETAGRPRRAPLRRFRTGGPSSCRSVPPPFRCSLQAAPARLPRRGPAAVRS
jgi:hypothetical protein